MFSRFLASLLLAAVVGTGAAHAQSPAPVTVPHVEWEFGNLRGLNLRKGQAVDFLLRYNVSVPQGTAENYRASVQICQYVPVKNAIPDAVDSCIAGPESIVAALAEVEPGTVYQGAVRFGYDPGLLDAKKVNRFTYTLTLTKILEDGSEEVVATQQLNDVIFVKKNNAALAGAAE